MEIANDSPNLEVRRGYLKNLEINRTSRYEMNA
jgi:hypothetical protein